MANIANGAATTTSQYAVHQDATSSHWGMGTCTEQCLNTYGQTTGDTDYTMGLQTPTTTTAPTTHITGQPPMGMLLPSLDPAWLQLISGAVMATVTNMQHGTGTLLGSPPTGNLTTTTQVAKLLNGSNKHSLLGFCGQTIQETHPKYSLSWIAMRTQPQNSMHSRTD